MQNYPCIIAAYATFGSKIKIKIRNVYTQAQCIFLTYATLLSASGLHFIILFLVNLDAKDFLVYLIFGISFTKILYDVF
jgi:hypothetical protein